MKLALLMVLALAGCSGGGSTAQDMSMSKSEDMATFKSNCGKPGDVGNSLGVGKFCEKLTDCSDNPKATLCAKLGDPDNYFCTFVCNGGDAGADECGENARCACDPGSMGRGCGCFPIACD